MTTPIQKHSGSKYVRTIYPCTFKESVVIHGDVLGIRVDVYCVLGAFEVPTAARGHAIKKLLCAGIRGKGDELKDLLEARDALDRDIENLLMRNGQVPLEHQPQTDQESKEIWAQFLLNVNGTRRPPDEAQPATAPQKPTERPVGDQPGVVPTGGRDGSGVGGLREDPAAGLGKPEEAEHAPGGVPDVSMRAYDDNPPWGPPPAVRAGSAPKPKKEYDLGGGGGGD